MTTSTQTVTCLGLSCMEGVSKKTGNPYSIGKLFVMYPQTGKGVWGYMGAEISADVHVLEGLTKVTAFPCQVNIEVANVMKFGNPVQQIMSVTVVTDAQAQTTAASKKAA